MASIEVKVLDGILGYKVLLPEFITSKSLIELQDILSRKLEKEPIVNYCLLLDSNAHEFESIETMKQLRDVLSLFTMDTEGLKTIAFVKPKEHGGKTIVSPNEAYFNDCCEALIWLKQNQQKP